MEKKKNSKKQSNLSIEKQMQNISEQAVKAAKSRKVKTAVGLTLGALGLATAVVVPIVVYNSNKNIIVSIYQQNAGADVIQKKIKQGTRAKDLAIVQMSGYEFVGYFKDEACTQPLEEDAVLNKNTTIYAKYNKIQTLTINNGEEVSTYKVYTNETLEDVLDRINFVTEKTGYEFLGFYADEEFTTPISETTLLEEDVTVYTYYKQVYTLSVSIDGTITTYTNYADETIEDTLTRLNLLEEYTDETTCGWYADEKCTEYISSLNEYLSEATTIYTKMATLEKLTITENTESCTVKIKDANQTGEVVVPKVYNGKPVTKINSLQGENITSITIPYGVESLGSGRAIIITSKKLTELFIPETVNTITGGALLKGCVYLESIKVDENNETFTSRDFAGNELNCVIQKSTKTLKSACRETTIPDDGSVTKIGASAFYDLGSYFDVNDWFTIPEGVTSISGSAFRGTWINKISLPSTLSEFKYNSMEFEPVTDIKVHQNNETYTSRNIAGEECNCVIDINSKTLIVGTKKATIPSDGSVTIIGDSALIGYQQANPENPLVINSYITEIGQNNFYNSNITAIELPASLTVIDSYAFNRCKNLQSIKINENNTTFTSRNIAGEEVNAIIDIANKSLILGCVATNIPDDGSVTKLDDYSFAGCEQLTSISINNNITEIGANAFVECVNLASVTFDAKIYTKWQYAFNTSWEDISKLRETVLIQKLLSGDKFRQVNSDTITIPADYTTLDAEELRTILATQEITSIFVEDTNPVFTSNRWSINGIVDKATKTLVFGWENTTIPNDGSIIKIGDNAFKECANLVSIVIPSSVKTIGEWAFNKCDLLESVTITDGVESIGANAFRSCALTSIEIPGSVKTIGDSAFARCESLESVSIAYGVTTIGANAFKMCDSLTSIEIPSSVTSIGEDAFSGCNKLTSITLHESSIGKWQYAVDETTWADVSELSETELAEIILAGKELKQVLSSTITISSTATEINMLELRTLFNSGGVNSIVVDDANTKYSSQDSSGNEINGIIDTTTNTLVFGWENTTIPDDGSVTKIGDEAFKDCVNLFEITIPTDVTSIGARAFMGCSIVETIDVPNTVQSIGEAAFQDCAMLQYVNIPEGVTIIRSNTFNSCSSLGSVTLPSTLQEIETYAFAGCISITSVEIPENVTYIYSDAFLNCTGITEFILPEGDWYTYSYSYEDGTPVDTIIPSGSLDPYAIEYIVSYGYYLHR